MAHNINRMAFSGETPWHGIGTQLPRNGTYEQVKDAAGFYHAVERPLFAAGDPNPITDRKAIYRADSNTYLATVGDRYQVIQFDELARAGVTAAGGAQAIWHTAGTLGETGARGWMLAELPNPIKVAGDPSEIRKYMLLTTAHDGSSAAILANVATRVVCQNTLGVALGENGAKWSIRHTPGAGFKLEHVASAFRAMAQRAEKFGELANELVKVRLTSAQYEQVIAAVVPIDNDGEAHPRLEAQRSELRAMRETFTGISSAIVGTAWGDLQAATEWAQWNKPVRALTDTRLTRAQRELGARLNSTVLGDAASASAAALTEIVTLSGLSMAGLR